MTLAGWGWLTLRPRDAGIDRPRSTSPTASIRYLAPLYDDLHGERALRRGQDWAAIAALPGRARPRPAWRCSAEVLRRRPATPVRARCTAPLRAEAGIMRAMTQTPPAILAARLLVLLAAPPARTTPGKKASTWRCEYGGAVRWSDWDMAWQFVDPAARTSSLMTDQERERLKQIKVTGYEVRTASRSADGTHRAEGRDPLGRPAHPGRAHDPDRQIWRTDDDGKHWWLTSGLPDF